tara:strand:- start:2015 stop:2290 length:276 start_codon:yes stop_codon:yes gene_type:complete
MEYKKTKKIDKKKNKKSLKKKKNYEIDNIKESFELLKDKYSKSKKNQKDKLVFEEFSTQLLLKLDNIHDEKNKNIRKKTISYIIAELDNVE